MITSIRTIDDILLATNEKKRRTLSIEHCNADLNSATVQLLVARDSIPHLEKKVNELSELLELRKAELRELEQVIFDANRRLSG